MSSGVEDRGDLRFGQTVVHLCTLRRLHHHGEVAVLRRNMQRGPAAGRRLVDAGARFDRLLHPCSISATGGSVQMGRAAVDFVLDCLHQCLQRLQFLRRLC